MNLLNPTCDVPRLGHYPTKKPFKGAVYLQGNCFYSGAVKLFETGGYELVRDIRDADIVCWLGGADINPQLYGEKPCGAHFWDEAQDADDLAALDKAGDRFKIGICRGAQLLNCIPNKGSLWQDVNKHTGGFHPVTDVITGSGYLVNSIHHQQLILADDAELIAYANESTRKESEKRTWHVGDKDEKDVEAAWYEKTKSLCVQWHPEVGGRDSSSYFFDLVNRYYHAA